MVISHRIMPGLTEDISGDIVHRQQLVLAPPAPTTSGTLYQPMPSGTGVEGGVRARMRVEDQARSP